MRTAARLGVLWFKQAVYFIYNNICCTVDKGESQQKYFIEIL